VQGRPALAKAGGDKLESEKVEEKVEVEAPKKKPKKKKGKIAQVYAMHQKGVGVKEIAEKMGLSERVARSYIWRKQNPEKYAELLKRYFDKRKQKQGQEKADERK
jgi:DNA-binding NarL/FixJ family response regulator